MNLKTTLISKLQIYLQNFDLTYCKHIILFWYIDVINFWLLLVYKSNNCFLTKCLTHFTLRKNWMSVYCWTVSYFDDVIKLIKLMHYFIFELWFIRCFVVKEHENQATKWVKTGISPSVSAILNFKKYVKKHETIMSTSKTNAHRNVK